MKITVSQTLSKTFDVDNEDGKALVQLFNEQHWGIEALLSILREYLEYDLKHLNRKRNVSTKSLLNQLASCRDWTLDEQEAIRE